MSEARIDNTFVFAPPHEAASAPPAHELNVRRRVLIATVLVVMGIAGWFLSGAPETVRTIEAEKGCAGLVSRAEAEEFAESYRSSEGHRPSVDGIACDGLP